MSKNQKQEEEVAYLVLVEVEESKPSWTTKTTASRSEGEQSLTTKNNYYNKQDGSYDNHTSKETYSFGSFGRGGQGYKKDYKVTDTYKVGNSRGYNEYTVEEKFRTVTYDNHRNYDNNSSITYDNHRNYDNNSSINYDNHRNYDNNSSITYDNHRNYDNNSSINYDNHRNYDNNSRITYYDSDSDSDSVYY